MTILVDHQLRRNMILERAFALFAAEGYGGVTYQKIADRCEISRTAIYKYFKNKEEIFTYAIILATGNLNTMVEKVMDRYGKNQAYSPHHDPNIGRKQGVPDRRVGLHSNTKAVRCRC